MCWKKIKGLFKKEKNTPPKMDMSQFKIRFSIKSMCLFERLSGKPFQRCMDSEEDLLMYMYSLFITSNDVIFTYSVFKGIVDGNESFSKWLFKECNTIIKYNSQMDVKKGESIVDNPDADNLELWAKDIASFLIVQGHLDPHYVYNEMEMWEVEGYYEMLEKQRKDHYAEQRLWTYLMISPHIDGKKIKGPEDLMKFPWEKSNTQKAKEDLDDKQQMILNTLKAMNKKPEE